MGICSSDQKKKSNKITPTSNEPTSNEPTSNELFQQE